MNFLAIPLLTTNECEAIVEELRAASGNAATVYGEARGGAVNPLVRKATRVVPSPETAELIRAALARVQPRLAGHFATELNSFEEPQFLRYHAGDYFVAHQDGNTPLIRDDSRDRRVSAIVFLSDPAAYEGGALVFHGDYRAPLLRETMPNARGSLLAFPPEQTHEVTPLIAGERYTIATWYR
jgi:SM-20-related protein